MTLPTATTGHMPSVSDKWPPERRAAEREAVEEGLAYARAWKERVRLHGLPELDGLPTAASGTFPYPHRTCAEWQ